LMGIVVPPTQIETDQIKLNLRVAAAQEHAGDEQGAMNAFGGIVQGAAPGTGIDAGGRGDVGARHADLALEFRLPDHQLGQVFLVHPAPVKKSCEKTSMAAQVSTSDRPAHSTTLLYHLSPSPARKVSSEFQKVTGFSWVPGVGTGWIKVPATQAS